MQLAQLTTSKQKRVPQDKQWEVFLSGLNRFSDDFMENGREQGIEEIREEYF
jgi:antitoxin VapB